MAGRLAFAFAAGLALGGCCHDFRAYVPPSSARAEFGPIRNSGHVKRTRSRHASNTAASSHYTSLSEHEFSRRETQSRERDSALDAVNQADDDDLRKKLVICRGCEQPATEDEVSAVWPTRAADSYVSLQKTLRSLSLPEAAPRADPQ